MERDNWNGNKYSKGDDIYPGTFIIDTGGIVAVGRARYSTDKNIVVYYNLNLDTIWSLHTKGYSLETPEIALSYPGHYILCNTNKENKLLWSTIDVNGKNKTIVMGTLQYRQIRKVLVKGNYAYVIGECQKEKNSVSITKVKLN